VSDRRSRPVTFAFNGGPGSASVWVHLGALGPKKALLDDEGMPLGPPPGKLIDNDQSVLDVTDLVFIDPVETGWSRPARGVRGGAVHWIHERRRVGRRIHPHVAGAQRSMELAEVHCR
jgi:carboxypeptidase C (cathepsin A)